MGVFPHEHVQCVTWINYRISSCNYIEDLDDHPREDIYCRLGPSY